MQTEFYSSLSNENALKNRYPNILTNESSRVKLRDLQPGETDFVNANLVSGFGDHPGYIATQAPLPCTMSHFWQMVYEENSTVIAMLTREQEERYISPKCDRYWPEPGQCILFGRYFVFGLGEQSNAALGIVERKFRITKAAHRQQSEASPYSSGTSGAHSQQRHWASDWNSDLSQNDTNMFQTPVRRPAPRDNFGQHVSYEEAGETVLMQDADSMEVTQIQYIDWPDQGVPETADTLLKMCGMVDDLMKPKDGARPAGRPVIHCSAGVGRTGTFIAVHKLLRAVHSAFLPSTGQQVHPVPVVQEVVSGLKRDRSKMVQTPEQYRFIYLSLARGLDLYRAQISANRGREQ